MSTNDKVGTTISGGGGVNLISADAFVEFRWQKSRVGYLSASLYYGRNQYLLLVIITREVFKTLKLVPTVQIKVPTLISIFMIIPLNYYST
jgi:sulfite reductase alpha subunit-like flavoprotein